MSDCVHVNNTHRFIGKQENGSYIDANVIYTCYEHGKLRAIIIAYT